MTIRVAGAARASHGAALTGNRLRPVGALPYILGAICFACAAPVHAQETIPSSEPRGQDAPYNPSVDEPRALDTIVIVGQGMRNSALSDIQPEVEYSGAEIMAFGVNTLEELLAEITALTASGRGRGDERPIILVNGQRVGSFRQIRSYPVEAIERVDVLPEEVALSYGYKANQRVINFVLKDNYKGYSFETEVNLPQQGAGEAYEVEFGVVSISGKGRWNIELGYDQANAILEGDRDLIEESSPYSLNGNVTSTEDGAEIDPGLSAEAGETVTIASIPTITDDTAPTLAQFAETANTQSTTSQQPFKSLRGESQSFAGTAAYNRTFTDTLNGSLSFGLDVSESNSLLGLPELSYTVPSASEFSPFAEDVLVQRFVSEFGALQRQTDSWEGEISVAANRRAASWNLSATSKLTHSQTDRETDRSLNTDALIAQIEANNETINPFGDVASLVDLQKETTESRNTAFETQLVVNRDLFTLPAGSVALTTSGTFDLTDRSSETRFAQEVEESDLSRETLRGQLSLDAPIISEDMEIPLIQDLSVNANADLSDVSDFGQLNSLGGGLNWAVNDKLSMLASFTVEDGAPSISGLGDPQSQTPNLRVFDYARNETVLVTRIDGGNPDLVADERTVWKVSAQLEPFEDSEFSIRMEYLESETDNPTLSFPTPTLEIEALFPERFVRAQTSGDEIGTLLLFDNRPINVESESRRQLSWNMRYSRPFAQPKQSANGGGMSPERIAAMRRAQAAAAQGSPSAPTNAATPPSSGAGASRPEGAPPQRPQGAPTNGAPATGAPANSAPSGGAGTAQARRGPPGGMPFGRGGPGGGRMFFNVSHVMHLEDRLYVDQTLAPLDYLDGSAKGSLGAQPEHEVNLRAGVFYNGLGARLRAEWQSGTRVDGVDAASALEFSDVLTANIRLFYRVTPNSKVAAKAPFLANSGFAFMVDNIFDDRIEVTDASGATPLSYQPYTIDPVGRSFEIEWRKQFN